MPWTTIAPYTYAIDYANDHLENEGYLRNVREGRPHLLHTFADTPLNSWAGNAIQTGGEAFRHISAAEMPARIESLKAFVAQAHEAGAKRMIPYVCTMIMVGNAETRDGFWKLYDNWEEFEHLGIGPKPDTDPIEWLQTGADKLEAEGLYKYEPSVHHPAWRQYLRACVDLVAQCGYDGTFLDVNALVSYHEVDRVAFSEYLSERYSKDELSDLFRVRSGEDVRLGKPGDGLLWFETARFRACAMGRLFAELRDVGRKHVDGFFVTVNNSPMSTIEAFYTRRDCGQGLAYVHDSCDAVMFEEMQQPGRFGMDRICDCILQFKYALAHGATGVTLLYNATDHDGNMLSNAEAAAAGGGAFVQPGLGRMPEMAFWGDWFQDHAELYAGKESVHDVGVLFFADQMYWENREHIEAAYRLRTALSDSHILFDFLVEPHFTPEDVASFGVVIVPHVRHMSRAQMDVLAGYVANDGRAVIIGECGTFDERGKQHEQPLRTLLDPHSERVRHVEGYADLVPDRGDEMYELSEELTNSWGSGPPDLTDRAASVDEAQSARNYPLVDVLRALTGERLTFLGDTVPYTLRVDAYRDTVGGSIIVHLVNYDLPVTGRATSGPPIPARDVHLAVPAKSARAWTPNGMQGEELPAGPDGVKVLEVEVYAMIEVTPL